MLAFGLALLPLIPLPLVGAVKSQKFVAPAGGPTQQSPNYAGPSNGSLPLQAVVPGKGGSCDGGQARQVPARLLVEPVRLARLAWPGLASMSRCSA